MALCNSCNSRFNSMGCYSPYFCTPGPIGPPGPPGPPGPRPRASSVLAWALGTTSNTSPGGGLAFTSFNSTDSDDFVFNGSSITIRRAGYYLIDWRLYIPRTAEVRTVISAQINQSALSGSRITVDHAANETAVVYSAQALATVSGESTLILASTNLISIIANSTDTVLSLSATKL